MSERKKTDHVTLIIVGLLLLGALVMGYQEASSGRLLKKATEAPDFTMTKHAGGAVQLSQLQGRVVLLDFWASWCPPCREEMPYLVKIAAEYEPQGVTFLAASQDDVDEQPSAVGKFVEQVPALAPYATYSTPVIGASYLVQSLPTMYIIDRRGKVFVSQSAMVSERTVRAWLDEVLGQQ